MKVSEPREPADRAASTAMRIAYLECFSGISGDMLLGALVDARPELAPLVERTARSLDVGAQLEITRVQRSGITATKVDVLVHGEKDRPREAHDHGHEHAGHDASHHDHRKHRPSRQAASPGETQSHGHEHAHGRSLTEIRRIVAKAEISDGAREKAVAVFEALGRAEAKIHGVDVEQIHFHEVGAADALVDIVCGCVGADALGADRWICSPLNVGGGTVECVHGIFPVPAPATVELLKQAPVYSSGLEVELVTPTGAALARVLASGYGAFPRMNIEGSGYGAGTRDFAGHANVLRLTVGEALEAEGATGLEIISVLEATIDDLNPQIFGYVMERGMAEGALEVFATPVQMKKSRPGTLITLLAKPQDAERLLRLLFAETTTLGVRMRQEQRRALVRRAVAVKTSWGEVRLKVASLNGSTMNYSPEYEDCKKIAEEQRLPLKTVMQEAVRAYLESQRS